MKTAGKFVHRVMSEVLGDEAHQILVQMSKRETEVLDDGEEWLSLTPRGILAVVLASPNGKTPSDKVLDEAIAALRPMIRRELLLEQMERLGLVVSTQTEKEPA